MCTHFFYFDGLTAKISLSSHRQIVERPKIDLGCENHQILCVEKDGPQVAKIRLGRGTLAGRSFSDKYVVTIAPYISRFLYVRYCL